MAEKPHVTVNIYNPHCTAAADSITAALQAATEAPGLDATPPIIGVKVIESDEGRRIEVAPELVKILVDFGWMPPVDGA